MAVYEKKIITSFTRACATTTALLRLKIGTIGGGTYAHNMQQLLRAPELYEDRTANRKIQTSTP
jgi:hypothetical protein